MDESPQRVVVVPGRDGVLHIDHSVPSPVSAPAVIEPTVLEVPHPQLIPPPVEVVSAQQYSQLTPVYAPTPVNTPADIPQPAVKGMEFVVPTPPIPPVLDAAYAPPPLEQVTNQAPIEPIAVVGVEQPDRPGLDSAPLLPITSLNSITDPGLVQSLPASYPQDYEQSIQNIDLDTMVSGTSDVIAYTEPAVSAPPVDAYTTPPVYIPPALPQHDPQTLTQTFTEPPEPPIVPVAVNPVASYFQSMPTTTISAMPIAVSNAAGSSIWSRFKTTIMIGIGVLVLGLAALGISMVINTQNVAITPEKITTPVEGTSAEKPAVVQAPSNLAIDPATPPAQPTPVVVEPTPAPVQQAPVAVNSAAGDVDAYRPEFLTIGTLGIKAPVQGVGLTTAGIIEAPSSTTSAGWYSASAQPGVTGAVLIDGHSSSHQNQLFYDLQSVKVGNTITLKRHDAKVVSYSVSKVSVVDRNSVSMTALLKPYGGAKRGLNIISATGPWMSSAQTHQNRVIVYAIEK